MQTTQENRAPFSTELNETQNEAVQTLNGPLLILAGAGSGKTRVLTYRIAHLISQGEASPGQILAVTFTNKAAKEMEARTRSLLQKMGIPIYEPLWISTFHSTCVKILREDIHLLGYQPFFGICDNSDQLSQIKKIMSHLNINDKVFPAKNIQSRINGAKRLALNPLQAEKKPGFFMDPPTMATYKLYEEEMKKSNNLDFGDLLMKTYELFIYYPDVLEKYKKRFSHILVDEYQDTNHIQYLITKFLSTEHRNLCVVGDEDQSIYSWRGADISNILNFEKDFPEAKVIKLEENYRSTQTIVKAASALIQHNHQRKGKTLFTSNKEGEKITVQEESTEYAEARFVAQSIEGKMREDSYSFKDFAVFYRTNAQSRVLEDLFRNHSIPYKLIGGMRFYERKEVKDIISYLKVILNPADNVSLKRIVNTPVRGIGKNTIEKVESLASEQGLSLFDSLLYTAEHRHVHAGACKKLLHFRHMMDSFIGDFKDLSLSEIYHNILDETHYVQKLKGENTPESQARIENLEELDNAIRQFEKERGEEASLQNFLEEMALLSDIDNEKKDDEAVTLMTLHVSKGLEFPIVFIVGMEDGLFPSARAIHSEDDTSALEEERRLAYVGMTRAQKKLFLTHSRTRKVWGQEQSHPPSRFIQEIPRKYIFQSTALRRPQSFHQDNFTSYGTRFQSAQQRAQQQAQQQMPSYENFSDEPPSQSTPLEKGSRVKHPSFGIGSVFKVEGQGDNLKVSVLFANKTSKKFIVKYARLEVL